MENVFELVGAMKINFKDANGKEVKGTKIHFLTEPTSQQKANGFLGKVADSHFFTEGANIPSAYSCGQHYEFLFSFAGGKPRVSGFRPVNLSNK